NRSRSRRSEGVRPTSREPTITTASTTLICAGASVSSGVFAVRDHLEPRLLCELPHRMGITLQHEHVVRKNPPVAGRDVATPAFPEDAHNAHRALAESFEQFHGLVDKR